MAARKPTDDDEQPNAAVVSTREYAGGAGWDVGQAAPRDAFRALDTSGTGEQVGPVLHEHPGGYARQIVAKGGLITESVKRELEAGDKSAESEQG